MSQALVVLACLLGAALAAPAAQAADGGSGEVIVRYGPGVDAAARAAVRDGVAGDVARVLGSETQTLDVAGSPAAAVAELRDDPHVLWAEPNGVVRAQWRPDDPFLSYQWAFHNTAQLGGTAGVDIDLNAAWDLERGSGSVLVGVVDTGINTAHVDLANTNRSSNPGETAANGVDDDANGLVDDVSGWDFTNGDAQPLDDNGHGSGTTGVIAAGTDDGIGIAGVASPSQILEVKTLGADGTGTYAALAQGLDYAGDQGARIVNVSIGGAFSQASLDAINAHPTTLYVVSAGNSAVDNDTPAVANYPCALPAANVLCVAATAQDDSLASFSNWGATTTDLGAPGVQIYSPTAPATSSWRAWSGTSFSSPMVAGVAALLVAHAPAISVADLKATLMTSGDPDPALAGKTVTGKRLNALRALQALESLGTGRPVSDTPPAISGIAQSTYVLTGTDGTWTSSGTATLAVGWQRCDAYGAACTPIAGTAGQHTYTVGTADLGHTLRFAVTATNGSGAAPATSRPTAKVTKPTAAPALQDTITMSGAAAWGATLSLSGHGTWFPAAETYAYRWHRCNAAGQSCGVVGTSSTYTLVDGDVGQRIFARVLASNANAAPPPTGTYDTPLTGVVTGVAATLDGVPVIAGTAAGGATVHVGTVAASGHPAPAITLQWQRCAVDLTGCTDLAGEVGSALTLPAATIGARVRVQATASNGVGTDSAVSAPTDVIAGGGGVAQPGAGAPLDAPQLTSAPTISGTLSVGSLLVLSPGTWAGAGAIATAVTWESCLPGWIACVTVGHQPFYLLTADDAGRWIRAVVSGSATLGALSATGTAAVGAEQAVAGGPAGAVPGGRTAVAARRSAGAVAGTVARRIAGGRKLRVPLRCVGAAGTRCAATVRVTAGAARRPAGAAAKLTVPAGRSASATVTLSAAGRRLVRRGSKVRVVVATAGRSAAAVTLTVR
jgi:hypothetical protein